MKSKKIIIASLITFVVSVLIIGSFYLFKGKNQGEVIGEKETLNVSNEEEEVEVALTISSNYDIKALTIEDIINNDKCVVVLGKIKSLDGSINQNPTTKEYTTIFSTGTLEVTEVLKGNLDSAMVNIMKRGGSITLAQYEKGLTQVQKEKEEMKNLLATYAKRRESVVVQEKSLDLADVEEGKEYLFVMNYKDDYGRYMLDTYKDAVKEVKRENSKIYLKDFMTNEYNTFTNLQDIFVSK